MDYEARQHRTDDTAAAVHSLAATGRTIISAAAMILVFGAFILGGEHVIKLYGVGPAGAVLLDGRIVIPGLTISSSRATGTPPGLPFPRLHLGRGAFHVS